MDFYLVLAIFAALVAFFALMCNKREETFIIPPNIVQAHDGYGAPGAIVDQGFETDIADYVDGQGTQL